MTVTNGHAADNRLAELEERARTARRPPKGPTGCLHDIKQALKHAGHRLTTVGVQDAMARLNLGWSESTVKATLSAAVDAGLLTNCQSGSPRGYGLPEWDAEAACPAAEPPAAGEETLRIPLMIEITLRVVAG